MWFYFIFLFFTLYALFLLLLLFFFIIDGTLVMRKDGNDISVQISVQKLTIIHVSDT